MNLNEIATENGMRDWTSGQRDTVLNDIDEIERIALVVKACIAGEAIDGDKPLDAQRRSIKVNRQFKQAIRHLSKAAAKFESINSAYKREVVELPKRRENAQKRKDNRRQLRALTRQKAHALTQRTLTESAQHLAVDPRAAGQQPPAAAPQPQYVNPHPHAYATPQANTTPLPDFADAFGNLEETG